MNFLTVFFLASAVHFSYAFYEDKAELTLRINDGEIVGRYITSASGRAISAFMGIPFASPPVGDLRFRAPQKAIPWNGTLLTQNEPAKCPQIDTFGGLPGAGFEGDENCLYVNVYVPERREDQLLDVLVWIHGGVKFLLEIFVFNFTIKTFLRRLFLVMEDVRFTDRNICSIMMSYW